jgi:hypothetical protein
MFYTIGPLFDTFVRNQSVLRYRVLILSSFIFLEIASAQTDTSLYRIDTLPRNFYLLHTKERDGESLPEIDLKEVVIIGMPSN